MSRKKTHEEYVKEVEVINPSVYVIGEYSGRFVKILHGCKYCGNVWESSPSSVLQGCGCPECGGSRQLTHQEYHEKLVNIDPYIEPLEYYINAKTSILHKCRICDTKWKAKPLNTLRGKGCPECARRRSAKSRSKTAQQYVDEMFLLNPFIEVIGDYINSYTKILHKCKQCGNQWFATPTTILSGCGCPSCSMSRGERNIAIYLTDHNIPFKPQQTFDKCVNKKHLLFDFYIPEMNVCIEYDGIQHFRPVDVFGGEEAFKITQNNDAIKNSFCESNNILLLRIKYDQDVDSVLDDFFKNNKQYKINVN